MNDRKFSLKAEHVLRCAQAAAGELGHGYVGCEHLLLAMLREEDDAACRALNVSGVYEPAVRERMIEKLGRGTAERSTVQGLTPHARCAVELAVGEALRAGSGEIEAGHLLLGILRDSGNMAVRLLRSLGVDTKKLYSDTLRAMSLSPRKLPLPEVRASRAEAKNGKTLFCPPIGHVQKGGDYRESFQPAHIDPAHLKEAQDMAEKVTRALTGAGLWGVEFFLSHENGVYFSELSPRPHDTGMVTLAGTQNLNEFELHCRAVLGLPIPGIKQERIGASAVILSPIASQERPNYRGMEEVTKEEDTYLRIFGKPTTRVNRRMGVVLCYAPLDSDLDTLRDKAKRIADRVEVY